LLARDGAYLVGFPFEFDSASGEVCDHVVGDFFVGFGFGLGGLGFHLFDSLLFVVHDYYLHHVVSFVNNNLVYR